MGLISTLFLHTRSADKDEDWNRGGQRVYIAGFTPDCDEVYVRENCGIVINDPHPSDIGMVVVNIEASQDDTSTSKFINPTGASDANNGLPCCWWKITFTFGPWNPLEHTATGNPINMPVDVSFDWQCGEQICDVAYDSSGALVPVVNSAGIPFDPPVTRESLKGIMRVAWNSLTFNPYAFFSYGNQINSDTWNGFPPGYVKFSPPKMPRKLYSQVAGVYYRLEAEFCFNPNPGGWLEKPIDRGYIARDSGGNLYKILDSRGQPYPEPSLLDGSGHVLATPTSFVQLTFQTYTSTSFATAFPSLTTIF